MEGEIGKDTADKEEAAGGIRTTLITGTAEASIQYMKCFNCYKKGWQIA